MSLVLFAPLGNYRGNACLAAAEIAGVKLEFHHVGYDELKKPEHLKRNPLG
jgi:hypothetical protein